MSNRPSGNPRPDPAYVRHCAEEARARTGATAIESVLGKGRGRDLLRYCYTATYPPLGAMKERKSRKPLRPHPGGWTRVYFHYPFCSGRCSFCHFNVSLTHKTRSAAYVRCLERELEMLAGSGQYRTRDIYFGGGTPSLMSAADIGGLINRVRGLLEVDPSCTITLEMHPDTVNRKYLGELRGRGINRISIGVQDFDNAVLSGTIRRHSRTQAVSAIAEIRRLRFDFNIDLLAPLPGQTDASWVGTLATAFSLDPDSVTVYTTSVRDTMPVRRKLASSLDLRSETRSLHMHAIAQIVAGHHGYEETTSRCFTRKSGRRATQVARECTADAVTPELGIGCGAYGLFGGHVYHNVPHVQEYLRRIEKGESPVLRARRISSVELAHRAAVLALRAGAIELDTLRWLAGTAGFGRFERRFEKLERAGLAIRQGQTLSLTDPGKLLSDELSTWFVSPSVRGALGHPARTRSNRFLEHLNHFYDLT